jgi:hypothetical protein
VDDADYQVPFPFTGTINTVGFKLGPSELMPEDHKAAQDMRTTPIGRKAPNNRPEPAQASGLALAKLSM